MFSDDDFKIRMVSNIGEKWGLLSGGVDSIVEDEFG